MKIHTVKQHIIAGEQQEEIKKAIKDWRMWNHATRQAFIDSINVYTSPAWEELRAGKFTASTASKFLADARIKDAGMGESAKALAHQIMAEMTGWRPARNPYMEYASVRRGLVFEDVARKMAEKELGQKITEVGFVEKNTMYGCSPDGLIMNGDKIEAVIEIKTPEPTAFYEQLMNCAKKEYQQQMQFAMWCCDCSRAYFVLYCPEVNNNVYILKYTRGMAWQAKLDKRASEMANYIQSVQEQVRKGEFNIPTLE